VTDLAEQAGITKQTVGFLVDQLERAGYARRMPDPADARARLVQIAPRGEAAVAVARVAEAEVEAEWARQLGKQGASQLRRALTRLREIIDATDDLAATGGLPIRPDRPETRSPTVP
jgi:DNA-binding MarR family transcriptional regulator